MHYVWFGFGKTSEIKYNGLDFVIMIAIKKDAEDKFRKDVYKSKRKAISDVWFGELLDSVVDVVRFAPSGCNTQPWIVENKNDEISVYRYKEVGKRGVMPIDKVTFSNRIDIGILMLFVELSLKHQGYQFERSIYDVFKVNDETEGVLIARYKLG